MSTWLARFGGIALSRRRSINPSSPEWNHAQDCYATRDLADMVRVAKRVTGQQSLPPPRAGMRYRWRIRKCRVCPGFFIRMEMEPKMEQAR